MKAPFGRICLELFQAKQANPSKTGGIPLGGSGSTLYRLSLGTVPLFSGMVVGKISFFLRWDI